MFHRQTRRLAITEAKVKFGFDFPESFVPIVSATRAMSYVADGILCHARPREMCSTDELDSIQCTLVYTACPLEYELVRYGAKALRSATVSRYDALPL